MIELRNISKSFGDQNVLNKVSATFQQGKVNFVIGRSGSGKSVMTKCTVGLLEPDEGDVLFDGRNFTAMSLKERKEIRKEIGMLFQGSALFDSMTVAENVMAGAHIKGKQNFFSAMTRIGLQKEERELRHKAYETLEMLNLLEHAEKPCDGLPFGTMKRIELARALVSNPKLLLLDEPATGLTHSEVTELSEVIISLRKHFELTILLVEHHMGMVMSMSEKVVVLDFGEKIAEGTPSEIQNNPLVVSAYLGAPK